MVQTPDRWRILPAIGGEGLPPSTRLYGHLQGFGLHDQPEFSERFMSHLLARNVRVEADLVDQLFNSSEKRLARLLLILANFGKDGKPEPVIAKISQETLAEMNGTTRSRVSSFMNKFRKLGLINYNGHLEVHSSLLNVVLHDDPHINRDPDTPGEFSTKAGNR